MKKLVAALAVAVVAVGVSATAGVAQDTGDNALRPLEANQTEGFGLGDTQVFTYAQNFHCTIEPFDDLDGIGRNGDGELAASDPDEMILPECISGETRNGSLPQVDPAGIPTEKSRKFWAIVPVFDADGDLIPEGLDPSPGVDLQCPEPGAPTHSEMTPTGACTMHPSLVAIDPIIDEVADATFGLQIPDLFETLPDIPQRLPVETPIALPVTNPGVLVPLPSHSHIVETGEDDTIWWQVIVVLVKDPAVWPTFDGDCAAGRENCLTSLEALRASQEAGGSDRDIPTNIWLNFANQPLESGPLSEHAGH